MANLEIANDTVVTVPIHVTDAAGDVVPATPGDVFTVASDNAGLGVALGADATGGPAAVLTPMVRGLSNVTVTVTDSAGLKSVVLVCDVVEDIAPANIVLDVAGATTAPQPVPTAP